MLEISRNLWYTCGIMGTQEAAVPTPFDPNLTCAQFMELSADEQIAHTRAMIAYYRERYPVPEDELGWDYQRCGSTLNSDWGS